MKRIGLVTGLLFALAVITPATAGTASGDTEILGVAAPDALPGVPTDVKVSIITGAPVVPYEYSLVNRCWFGTTKTSGPSDSYERFDLIGPWYDEDGLPETVDPYTIVKVNLNPVPDNSTCKVLIVKNNTAVKGSTTTYSVAAP